MRLLSNFISSNRILKSSQISYDKGNTVTIKHEANPFQPEIVSRPGETGFLPGNVYEYDIRAENMDLSAEELAGQIIERAKEEAAKMVEAARSDADLILNRMEEDARERIRFAEEESRRKGYEEGYAKAETETEVIKNEAHTLYTNAVRERQESFEAFEEDILRLIIDVVSKLLTDEVKINPQTILYLIRKGFQESSLSGDVTVRVSGDDYDAVNTNYETLLQYAEAGVKLDVVKDYSLGKGDCIIETPFGMIDCSLDQQYEALKRDLYRIFENR